MQSHSKYLLTFTHMIMVSERAQIQLPNCNITIFFQFYNGRHAKFLTIVYTRGSQWLLCNLAS